MLGQLKEKAKKLKDKITKNPLEKALSEATSDENLNPSTKVLHEIAMQTFEFNDFIKIMEHIWKKLATNEKKKWRRILKTLQLIDYLIKNGSPRCIQEFRDETYTIKNFENFTYTEEGIDRGLVIRELSKSIVSLLGDDKRIEEEREKALAIREKLDLRGFGSNADPKKNLKELGKSKSTKLQGFSSKDFEKFVGFGPDRFKDTVIPAYHEPKKEEPSKAVEKKSSDEFVVRQGTKYDKTEQEHQQEKSPVEKPKSEELKPLPKPKGNSAPTLSTKSEGDAKSETSSNPPSVEKKAEDIFKWDNSVIQRKPDDNWDWETAKTQPVNQPTSQSIQDLYKQTQVPQFNGPQMMFSMQMAPTNFGYPNANPHMVYNQMNPMSFNPTFTMSPSVNNSLPTNTAPINNTVVTNNKPITTTTTTTKTSTTTSTPSSNSENVSNIPKDSKEYKLYNEKEKNLIDLSDLTKEEPKKNSTPFGDLTNTNYQQELDAFWLAQNISNSPPMNSTFNMHPGMNMTAGQNQGFVNPMLLKQYQMMQAGNGNMQVPMGSNFGYN